MPRISEALNTYESYQRARGLSPLSIRQSSSAIRQVARTLSDQLIEQLTLPNLLQWQSQAASTVGPTTLHHKVSFARSFLAWCADMGWTDEALGKRLPLPKRAKPQPTVLSEDEMRRLLSHRPRYSCGYRLDLGLRDATMVRLLMFTGLIRAELVALNLGDVNLGAKTLSVRDGKGARDRVVALPEPAMQALELYLPARLGLRRNGHDCMSSATLGHCVSSS